MNAFQNIPITSHLNDAQWQPAAIKNAADVLPASGARLLGGPTFKDQVNRLSLPVEDASTQARKAAAGIVSQALILPVLQQLRREAQDVQTPFTPSNAENVFGTQFDQQIADHIANSPRMTVTNALAKRLDRSQSKAAAGSGTSAMPIANTAGSGTGRSTATTNGSAMTSLKTTSITTALPSENAITPSSLQSGSTVTLQPMRMDRWPMSRNLANGANPLNTTGTGVDLHG